MSGSLSDNKGKQKNTIIGFVVAVAVVLGLVFYNSNYPKDDLSGTIAKRKVVRSTAKGDVTLKDREARFTRMMQNTDFVDLVKSGTFQNMLANQEFMNLLASAEFQNVLANKAFASVLANREFASMLAS